MSMARRALHERDRPFTWLHLKLGPERNIPPSLPFYLFFHPFFSAFVFAPFFFIPSLIFFFFFTVVVSRYEIGATSTGERVIACRGKGCFDVMRKGGHRREETKEKGATLPSGYGQRPVICAELVTVIS